MQDLMNKKTNETKDKEDKAVAGKNTTVAKVQSPKRSKPSESYDTDTFDD
jgi:hypothetical protein